jgi:hypothetical protein
MPENTARVQQALTSAGNLLRRFLNNFRQRFCRFFFLSMNTFSFLNKTGLGGTE